MSAAIHFARGAGGLLTAALCFAPLAYGATRPQALWLLIALLGGAALCWVAGLRVSRRWPPAPPFLLLGLGLLALSLLPWLGLFVFTPAAEFTAAHFARLTARWPASIIATDAGALIALAAGLGLALWIVADLARHRRWLLVFTTAMVATAVAVTLIAFLQLNTRAAGIYWAEAGRLPGRFWGTFFHHTSAGAYLNTAWPLAAGLAVVGAWGRTKLGLIAAGLALILLLGAHATHLARFASLAALLTIPLFIWRFKMLQSRRNQLVVVLGFATIFALGLAGGRWSELGERWRMLSPGPTRPVQPIPAESAWPALVRADLLIPNVYNPGAFGDRGEAQRTAVRALAARPFTGHGPGNWRGAAGQHSQDPFVRSFYLHLQFTHADFLQAGVERGLAGGLSLLLLLGGGLAAALLAPPVTDPLILTLGFCAAAGLTLVLLQSLFDFPLQIPAVALSAHVLAGLGWARTSLPLTATS